MNTEQLAMLYDRLYDRADKLFKKYDLCAMTKDGCRSGKWGTSCGCYMPTLLYQCKHFKPGESGGCVSRVLGCKLEYCSCIKEIPEFKPILKQLDRMERVTERYDIWASDTKEQMIERRAGRIC